MKRENAFRLQLQKVLLQKFPNLYIQKHHGSQFSQGLPDVLFVYQGFVTFWELKALDKLPVGYTSPAFDWSAGKNVTALQYSTLRRINDAGGDVGVLLYVHPMKAVFCVTGESLFRFKEQGKIWTRETLDGYLTEPLARSETIFAFDWLGESTSEPLLKKLLSVKP